MAETPLEFADDRLRRVHEGLLLIGPGPAAFFRDACRLMADDRGLESVSHLVAHLLRDLYGNVLNVLSNLGHTPVTAGPIGPPKGPRSADASDPEADDRKHREKVEAALGALGVGADEPLARAWRGMPKDIGLHRWAHKRGLRAPRPLVPEFEETWEQFVRLLDAILDRFRAGYIGAVALVDRLLEKPSPTAADAKFLRDNAPHNPSLLSYFFGHCSNANWLKPLCEAGFFERANQTGDWLLWVQSEYLARVASAVPADVVGVIEGLPSTVSEPVLENLAKAARAMPSELAARAAGKIAAMLEPMEQLGGKEVAELVAHLARAGDTGTALSLATRLFDVVPAPQDRQEASEQAGLGPAEPTTRLEEWAFRERLGRLLPVLAEAAELEFVRVLAAVLDRCVTLQYPNRDDKPSDLSPVWRPAIEDHGQNYPFGTGSLLVGAVRAAAEHLVRTDHGALQAVIQVLEAHDWNVFTRLVLHMVRVTEPRDPRLVAHYLVDRRRFDDVGVQHEYARLLDAGFSSLEASERGLILSWIDSGPDLDEFASFIERQQGREAAGEELARYKMGWQLERLSWIKDHLTEEWHQRRASMAETLGEPDHPTFSSWHESFRGPVSPKSEADLASMSAEELSKFLRNWEPAGDHRSPTPEGLGRATSSVVKARAQQISADAALFVGLDATYVSAFFAGLRDAVKEGVPISWKPVLELASWATCQPREIPGRDPHDHDQDPHWGWCRRRIGDLLSEGFNQGSAELPFKQRAVAWAVLEALMTDPDPTVTDEQRRSMGHATAAINSVRGVALGAVCRYCLWVWRHLEKVAGAGGHPGLGFDRMPEARTLLDQHLDPQQDPSLAIRAVYGQHFPWLHLVDPGWARDRAAVVFPSPVEELDRWQAAWTTYVTFCHPSDALLPVLFSQYHLAIERIGKAEDADKVGHPDVRLGEHLCTFYCRATIGLASEDGLLAHFFEAAPPEVREAALGRVGWSLHHEPPGEPSDGLRNRLKRLWEWRAAAGLAPAEAGAFGWWFASGFFDDDWSLDHLEDALQLAAAVRSDYFVVGRLAAMAASHPDQCLRCLELLASKRDPSHLYGWRDQVAAVISAARHSGIGDARNSAEDFVNRLASQGLIDFRAMLGDEPQQG